MDTEQMIERARHLMKRPDTWPIPDVQWADALLAEHDAKVAAERERDAARAERDEALHALGMEYANYEAERDAHALIMARVATLEAALQETAITLHDLWRCNIDDERRALSARVVVGMLYAAHPSNWAALGDEAAPTEHRERVARTLWEQEFAVLRDQGRLDSIDRTLTWDTLGERGRGFVQENYRARADDIMAALSTQAAPTEPTMCECPPCPGRGLDGTGIQHCAECCFGTLVVADIDCPVHGEAAYRPVPQVAPEPERCPDRCLHGWHEGEVGGWDRCEHPFHGIGPRPAPPKGEQG